MNKKARPVRSEEKGPHRAGFLQLIFLFLFFLTAVFLHNQVGAFVNVAAAQRQNQITGLHAGHRVIGHLLKRGEPYRSGDFLRQILGVNFVRVRLAHGQNL